MKEKLLDCLETKIIYRGDINNPRGNKRKSKINLSSLIDLGDGLYISEKSGYIYYSRS